MWNKVVNGLSTFVLAAAINLPASGHAEVNSCLVGLWRPDLEDMAHVFATQMDIPSAEVSGIAEMEIKPDNTALMTFSDLAFDFQPPGGPPIRIVVTGVSDFEIETLESFIYFRDNTSDIIARAEFLGQVLEMSKDDFAPALTNGNFTAEFGCTDNSVSFEAEHIGNIPRRWHRIPES